MGSGISDYNVRQFQKISFAGAAVLVALLVASYVSWRFSAVDLGHLRAYQCLNAMPAKLIY
jgi:hypothetical protein